MRAEYLLMNDDATVTELTRCDDCGFLFRDIEKHVAESVTVPAVVSYDYLFGAHGQGESTTLGPARGGGSGREVEFQP